MTVHEATGRNLLNRLLVTLPSIMFAFGAALLPVFRIRVNRLQSGEPLGLFDLKILGAFPPVLPFLASAVLLPFVVERFPDGPGDSGRLEYAGTSVHAGWRGPGNLIRFAYAITGMFLFCFLVLMIRAQVPDLSGIAADRFRLSPESGFWCLIGICSYLFYRSGVPSGTGRGVSGGWAMFLSLSVGVVAWSSGFLEGFSLYEEWSTVRERFSLELLGHLGLSLWPLLPAAAFSFPLGIAAVRNVKVEKKAFAVFSMFQIVPSLAVFGLLMPVLSAAGRRFPVLRDLGIGGLGFAPVFIALTLYSILPLLRGVFLGIRSVEPQQLEAARGMGMTGFQILSRIELPLALPAVLDGARIALVQSIGLATLGALIGAGGLGWFVFQGLGQGADDLILLGSLTICTLAIAADGLMRRLGRFFVRGGNR